MSKFRFANTILFWGALWGIFEATIGYLLHLLPVNVGYIFWFPIALFFMKKAYKSTGKLYGVLLVALFAASIKLVNLFTDVRIDKVINPAISIIIEALAVFLVYYFSRKLPKKNNLAKAISVSIGWRFLYIIYLLFVPNWMYNISVLSSRNNLITFLLIQSAVNALTIYVYYIIKGVLEKKESAPIFRKFAFMPIITFFLIAIDIVATLLL